MLGEANFSDHGANRLGASALMQGLADGYFVLPDTIGDYLAPLLGQKPVPLDDPAFREAEAAVDDQVAQLLVDQRQAHRRRLPPRARQGPVGQLRHGAHRAEPRRRRSREIPALREEFWKDVRVLGENETRNQSLEKAGRVADFLEFGELLVRDALHREESCGGHFREEHQTEDGEALRDDEHFAYVAAWECTGDGRRTRAAQGTARVRVRPPVERSYK